MIIELRFDYHTVFVSFPDGYIIDGNELRSSFLSWVEDQPNNIVISKNGVMAVNYGYEDVINYFNTVLLYDSKEKAYLIPKGKIRKPIKLTLSF